MAIIPLYKPCIANCGNPSHPDCTLPDGSPCCEECYLELKKYQIQKQLDQLKKKKAKMAKR
jgi:hypothetical protein